MEILSDPDDEEFDEFSEPLTTSVSLNFRPLSKSVPLIKALMS